MDYIHFHVKPCTCVPETFFIQFKKLHFFLQRRKYQIEAQELMLLHLSPLFTNNMRDLGIHYAGFLHSLPSNLDPNRPFTECTW